MKIFIFINEQALAKKPPLALVRNHPLFPIKEKVSHSMASDNNFYYPQ